MAHIIIADKERERRGSCIYIYIKHIRRNSRHSQDVAQGVTMIYIFMLSKCTHTVYTHGK